MLVYLLAVAVVLIAALLAFGIAYLLHLHGTIAIVFIVLILLLGLGAAAAILILHFRAKKKQGEEGDTVSEGAAGELDVLINDANRKLRESQQGAKTLDALPLVYILGEAGTAKTTVVLRSGLDPELVAGVVPGEGESVPTQVLNLWFTRLGALLEAGNAVRLSNALLTRLVERTRAKAYRSAFGSGAAARAAIVCVSAEQLLLADGGTALMASARATCAQLREISRLLGATLPVYVLVTKLDRVPHFEEYVRNLSQDEVRQVLGSTMPKSDASAGVYADEATRRLTGVLDSLCYKLGEFRLEVLERETDPRNTSGVYEFPREFGKLRKNLNQYLVELCKPSQLSANPYLRGFYFTGIRAQIVERMANAPAAQEQAPQNAGATQYLNITTGKQPARPAGQPVMVASRVPQWTFLPRLLPEIILGDKSALSATQQTAPARLFRRVLFGTLGGLFLLYTILLVVSFFKNSGLEHRIENAARALPKSPATASSLPSLSDLQNLDELRQIIVQLDGYAQDGAPLSYRWGLYKGEELDAKARHIYFDRFRPMMLNPTQANWVAYLHGLPDAPAQGADFSLYNDGYRPLKAYLMTAGNHEKSAPQFLTPVFLQYWWGTRQIDPAQQQLAQQQADFYGAELLKSDPYQIQADTSPASTVQHARSYLNNFGDKARIYQAMLNDADKTSPNIDFNKMYPGSAAFVTDGHVIRGAFSKAGFAFMQDAIQHPDKYVSGEQWVLGNQTAQSQGTASLSKDLAAQYSSDFLKEWHLFLTDARVVSCGGLHEAGAKLQALAGPNSPLLALFYTVSHNTAVSDAAIKSTFQPAQAMADPNNADRFIGPGNTGYVNALLSLGGAVDQVAQNPTAATDPAAYAPIVQAASSAGIAAQQAAQSFNVDPAMHTEATVLALMQAPVQCAAKLPPSPGAPANGAGAKICGAISPLLGKFPFAPKSTNQATLAEVNQVFAPESGTIFAVYGASLKQYLIPQMALYVPNPAAPQPVNPRFAQFFSHAAHVSAELYPIGAKTPALNFTLRFLPSAGVQSATFVVDGQRIPAGATTQQFHWSGADAQKAQVVYDGVEAPPFQGTWSLFQLVRAANITKSGAAYKLDYHIDTATTFQGQKVGQAGAVKTVSFELSGPGADILAGDGLSGLSCVGPVVK